MTALVQAETKWKWKINSLTLPTIKMPTIEAVGRRNATIGWLSMFQAKPGDATEYGYNITWHHGHESEVYGYLTIPHEKVCEGE